MANYTFLHPVGNAAYSQQFTLTATSTLAPLGLKIGAYDSNLGYAEFLYCRGVNGTSSANSGDWVLVSGGFNAAQANLVIIAQSKGGQVGVAAGNLSNTNVYGWVQVYGMCDYAKGSNSSIAQDQPLLMWTNARVATSGTFANAGIIGAWAGSSYTSSQSNSLTAFLNYPSLPYIRIT